MFAGGVLILMKLPFFVHAGEHIEDMDRIEVEHRLGKATVALLGIIAGNDKQVMQIMSVPAEKQ